MKNCIFQKTVLSPFIAVLFIAISITGVLLLFHVRNGMIMEIHKLAGVVFVIAGLIHLIMNFGQFAAYFSLRKSWISLVVALAIVTVLGIVGLTVC